MKASTIVMYQIYCQKMVAAHAHDYVVDDLQELTLNLNTALEDITLNDNLFLFYCVALLVVYGISQCQSISYYIFNIHQK